MVQNNAPAPSGQAPRCKLPPFNAVPARAMRDRRLTGADHSVLQCIASHDRFSAYKGGQPCWASVRTMAKETGLGRRTVERSIERLTELGYVTNRRVSQNKRHLAIVYAEQVSPSRPAPDAPGVAIQTGTGVAIQTGQSTSLNHFPKTNSAEAASALKAEANGVEILALQGEIEEEQDGADAPTLNEEDVADGAKVGRYLRKVQRAITRDAYVHTEEATETFDNIAAVHHREPVGNWAYGLGDRAAAYAPAYDPEQMSASIERCHASCSPWKKRQ